MLILVSTITSGHESCSRVWLMCPVTLYWSVMLPGGYQWNKQTKKKKKLVVYVWEPFPICLLSARILLLTFHRPCACCQIRYVIIYVHLSWVWKLKLMFPWILLSPLVLIVFIPPLAHRYLEYWWVKTLIKTSPLVKGLPSLSLSAHCPIVGHCVNSLQPQKCVFFSWKLLKKHQSLDITLYL